MIEKNRLDKIVEAINEYDCSTPLHHFLNSLFKKNRNMGSNDRKIMRIYVYNYFRLGKCLEALNIEQKIAMSTFLIQDQNSTLTNYCLTNYSSLNPENIKLSFDEKIKLAKHSYPEFDLNKIFPFTEYLSHEISPDDFCKSFLIQPDVWIRVREKYIPVVLNEMKENKIEYRNSEELSTAFSINNSVPLTELKTFRKGYFEIQDLSSQKTAHFFQPSEKENWWDCCPGSGGKSLLLAEKANSIKITATDTRETVLKNLKERFQKAQIKNIEIKNLNLLTPNSEPQTLNFFDGTIADVPCTGSGTWSRTPERLSCFNVNEIEKFSSQQKEILKNVTPNLKKGKPLIYITCSVFKKENEDTVEYCVDHLNFSLEEMSYLKGYSQKADTLFAARLIKR